MPTSQPTRIRGTATGSEASSSAAVVKIGEPGPAGHGQAEHRADERQVGEDDGPGEEPQDPARRERGQRLLRDQIPQDGQAEQREKATPVTGP